MSGFVYRWTCQNNGKWYIGSRNGVVDDGYRHSSKNKEFLTDEKLYGLENFVREILFIGDKIKSKEAEYLNESNAAKNPMSYNQTNITRPNCWTDESNVKRSETQKGRQSPLKGKTYEEIYGSEKASELRVIHREAHIGNTFGKGNRGNKYPQRTVTCPNCDKTGGSNAMKRWHFDNCKSLISSNT